MNSEGPLLESLLRRLSECPAVFTGTVQGRHGGKQLAAIIGDHFREFGGQNPIPLQDRFLDSLASDGIVDSTKKIRHCQLIAIAVWLLHDDWFLQRPQHAHAAWVWLQGTSLKNLADLVIPEHCVTDADRREELVRLCLAALDLRPLGESIEQARDRMTTLDSAERVRILRATAAAEKRAREVREAMAREKALESASRYGE